MAKSDWLNHVTNTYKMLKQSNPEAKLKDAMKAASKSFKKVSSTVRSFVPMNGRRTKHHRKGRKSRRTGRSRKYRYRGGNEDLELQEQQE